MGRSTGPPPVRRPGHIGTLSSLLLRPFKGARWIPPSWSSSSQTSQTTFSTTSGSTHVAPSIVLPKLSWLPSTAFRGPRCRWSSATLARRRRLLSLPQPLTLSCIFCGRSTPNLAIRWSGRTVQPSPAPPLPLHRPGGSTAPLPPVVGAATTADRADRAKPTAAPPVTPGRGRRRRGATIAPTPVPPARRRRDRSPARGSAAAATLHASRKSHLMRTRTIRTWRP